MLVKLPKNKNCRGFKCKYTFFFASVTVKYHNSSGSKNAQFFKKNIEFSFNIRKKIHAS